jgi:Recombination endonuclease VII
MNLIQPLISKRCCTCKESVPISLFGKDRSRADGYQARCKPCTRSIKKKYNPESSRFAQIKHLYGITRDQYEDLLTKQDHKCAICKADECTTGRQFAVDHDHKTGTVRGLLCADCNLTLGKFNDEIERFKAAIAYLEASQTSHS